MEEEAQQESMTDEQKMDFANKVASGIETRIISVPPKSLKLLDVNARFMRHEQFQRLVDNIRRDGGLTSVPFAAKYEDTYEVLSGNHRVQAAIEAGLDTIHVMVTDEDLSKHQRIAIQLSHNALVGEDDPQTLRDLYDQIDEIDLRMYTGMDDRSLGLLEDVSIPTINESRIEYVSMIMMFLPDDLKEIGDRVENVASTLRAHDERWVARMDDYDRFLDWTESISQSFNVKNQAAVLDVMLTIVERNIDQFRDGYLDENLDPKHKSWVPIQTVFNRDDIPTDTASLLTKCVKKAVGSGEVTEETRWKTLSLMAKAFLE